jgi:hypothetical protein
MAHSTRRWCVRGMVLALALAGFAPAVGAHGGDPALVHSCVNKSSGEVKIIAPNGSCKPNETALDWPRTAATPGEDGGVLHARSNFVADAGATKFAMFVEEGTEAFVRIVIPRSGSLANLFVHPTDTPAGGSMTVVVRVNGADTALAVTHPSIVGTSAVSNTADTVAVNQGDFVAVKFTHTADGGGAPGTVYRASFELK